MWTVRWTLPTMAMLSMTACLWAQGSATARPGGGSSTTRGSGGGGGGSSSRPAPKKVDPFAPYKVYTKDNAPAAPKLEDLPQKDSVSQYGITWTFDKPARVGQFINGDWYVVGATTVRMIDPKPLFGAEVGELINKESIKEDKYPGKQARNGSSLNPASKGKLCGFDSRTPSDRYDPALFTPLPIAMKPGDSLVSTISRRNDEITKFGGQHVDPLRGAAVLTSVAEPQPADAFRPSYTDCAKSKIYLARNLRRDLLLKLQRPAGAPATLDVYARYFQRPWIDLADFGFAAPQDNMPHYGQQMVEQEGEAALLLLCDYPAQEKENVLIGLVQIGIDFYGVGRGGFVWQAHGGLNSGRKLPIVLAGFLLEDKEMAAPCKSVPGLRFAEDDQTAMCPYTYRWKDKDGWHEKTFEKGFTGAKAIFLGWAPYLKAREELWMQGGGTLDLFPPSQWPPRPGEIWSSEGYRRANTSACWVGQALAMRLLHMEKVWDHDPFFAYVDRWMTEDDTEAVKAIRDAGFVDYTKAAFGTSNRQGNVTGEGQRWVREMWSKHRDNLPPAADGTKTPKAADTWK